MPDTLPFTKTTALKLDGENHETISYEWHCIFSCLKPPPYSFSIPVQLHITVSISLPNTNQQHIIISHSYCLTFVAHINKVIFFLNPTTRLILSISSTAPDYMRSSQFVVWPTTSCCTDWLKHCDMTFIITEWRICLQLTVHHCNDAWSGDHAACIIAMMHSHVNMHHCKLA